jgi:predicted Rossmann-fold nucleotide-binding protein
MQNEIDKYPALDAWIADAARTPAVFQGLDLRRHARQLCGLDLTHCIFIGCRLPPRLAAHAAEQGCTTIPDIAGKAFRVFRTELYSPEELFAGFQPEDPDSYRHSPDRIIYDSFLAPAPRLDEVLARRLHDFSVTDALEEFLSAHEPRGIVAIMGGHDTPRGDAAYRGIASLTRTLTADGYLIVSGGGPGIMEAANLGAYFARESQDALTSAIDALSVAPLYKDRDWLAVAWRVRKMVKQPGRSVGVPTWFYGHEPPNAFSTDIAKYFENSVREEGLLAIARSGVVFAEGNAGTVQEIFQDACQNYYRTYYGTASPMVLFGRRYWTGVKPVEPLLRTLAREKAFDELVLISDDIDEIASFLRNKI